MTFACRTFQGMGGGGSPINFTAGLGNTLLTTGVRSASFTLVNDGTSTVSRSPGGGGGSISCGPWFSPSPTVGVGSQYWCKLVLGSNAGTVVSGSGVGSVISIGGAGWTFTSSSTTTEGTGAATVNVYADAAGTILVATGSVSWDVGYTP
jgi:hypothetical protein